MGTRTGPFVIVSHSSFPSHPTHPSTPHFYHLFPCEIKFLSLQQESNFTPPPLVIIVTNHVAVVEQDHPQEIGRRVIRDRGGDGAGVTNHQARGRLRRQRHSSAQCHQQDFGQVHRVLQEAWPTPPSPTRRSSRTISRAGIRNSSRLTKVRSLTSFWYVKP